MKVEIWSDIVCPWCYIGKRRFEAALAGFEHRDEVAVLWHSFELDPVAPPVRAGALVDHLASKYGVSGERADQMHAEMTNRAAAEGLDFHFEKARSGNTFDAHRLVHLGAASNRQDAVEERFFRAYLTEGEAIGEPATLRRLAVEAGLDAAAVDAVLAGERFAEAVRADEVEAAQLGIRGVPFFVIDRAYGVSGAQPADLLLAALRRAWTASHPLAMVGGTGDTSCADGSCSV
ncbi:MAG: DsbA family oxidoreductase [Candidatus Dormibacteria bacterium]